MHIYFMGYRGSGKTTVAKRLASLLSRPVVDTDDLIEAGTGLTIREIFAEQGEVGFRDLEQRAVAQAAASPTPTLIALGGGAILRQANRDLIRSTGHPIWLAASAAYLWQRISGDEQTAQRRPNLSVGGGYDEVVKILAEREPIYRELAEKVVFTDDLLPDEVVAEIADWVNSLAD